MSIKEKIQSRPPHPVIDEAQEINKPGMKWHKFLVNFALFAASAWNIFMGVLQLTGWRYILNSHIMGNGIMLTDFMYLSYPLLKFADTLFYITMFLMAAYQIVIRQMLKKGKKHAPLHLNIMIVIMCTVSALYDFLFEAAVHNESFVRASINYSSSSVTIATAMIIGTALCIANWYYYKKRRNIQK